MSWCGCPIASDIEDMVWDCEDPWEDWSKEDKPIEKDTRCCECRELLPKGTVVSYTEGYPADEDGEPDYDNPVRNVTCVPCDRIRESLYCGNTIYGVLRDQIGEQMGFDYVTGEDTWEIEDEDKFVIELKEEHDKEMERQRAMREAEQARRFITVSNAQLKGRQYV